MPASLEFSIGPDDKCPKCDDNAQPTLKYLAGPPEKIKITCATCGWSKTQPCADAVPPT
jgi:hypothetical protein